MGERLGVRGEGLGRRAKALLIQLFSSSDSKDRHCHPERSEGPGSEGLINISLKISNLQHVQALRYAQGDNDDLHFFRGITRYQPKAHWMWTGLDKMTSLSNGP